MWFFGSQKADGRLVRKNLRNVTRAYLKLKTRQKMLTARETSIQPLSRATVRVALSLRSHALDLLTKPVK